MSLYLVLSAAICLIAGSSCGGKNRPADIPTVPVGRDSCFVDTVYTYTTIATDPDSDDVSARIDWGDSTTSQWSGLVTSGETLAFTHAWSDTGTYHIRAQARDAATQSSDWSGATEIHVYVARPAPGTPAEPEGPAKGDEGAPYTFSSVAFHPGSINVAIRFAWGDGDTSSWSEFVAPGESVSMQHTWPVPDTYVVTAQAKDTGNATSQWSAPHTIRIWPPDTLSVWRVKLTAVEGDPFYSSPAFGPDGNIYVGSPDGALYSLRPDSTLRWRYATGQRLRSSPAIGSDGTVYVGSYDNILYAINSDGTTRWTYQTDDFVHASPAIGADGVVYVASLDHWFHAINPDGSRKWRVLAGKAARSSPAVAADGVICVGSDNDSLYAVNPEGTTRWSHNLGGTIRSSPSFAADGTIYCGSDDGHLYALKPDGSLSWQFATGGPIQGSAVLATNGTIYFGSDDSSLYALNSDGTLKWRYPTGGSISASPAVASDGTVYFGSADYSVYAINSDGSARWQFETDGAVQSSPTIGPDGKVYVTSRDGYLYALKGTSPLASAAWPKFHHDLRNSGRASGTR